MSSTQQTQTSPDGAPLRDAPARVASESPVSVSITPTAATTGPASSVPLPTGFRDQFLERRFENSGQIDLEKLSNDHSIAFLTKAVHLDELYLVDSSVPGLPAGQYRIRSSGSERPFLTLKKQGDGIGRASESIDDIDPDDRILEAIRKEGKLLAVIEKYRQTYHSKNHPQCLLHVDKVAGLGDFYDVKADKPEHLEAFLAEIGLQNSTPIDRSYLQLKQERGISEFQLGVWKFQQKFSDYILGVVSGTLTPLGLLTTTIAGGGSKPDMIVSLIAAGLCDGLSDSVAAAQAAQSESNGGVLDQLKMFAKTMAGKFLIPCSFVPIVLTCDGALSTGVASALWAGILLSGTAAVQAISRERPALPAMARLVAFGATAVAVGTAIGKAVLPLLESALLGTP